MLMGLGCNAAAIVGCRIIDSPRERLIAILTNAFVPCNGRFPALIAVISMFFTYSAFASGALAGAVMLTALLIVSVAATLLCGRLLSRTLLKGEQSSFTLELPPFRMPRVGRLIVRSVVEHGQCITLNSTKHTAVFMLHPFAISSARISQSAGSSSSEPDAVYAIMAMGRTISFAGKPSMNAISIAPSSPNTRANGSRKSTAAASIDCPPMLIFDNA